MSSYSNLYNHIKLQELSAPDSYVLGSFQNDTHCPDALRRQNWYSWPMGVNLFSHSWIQIPEWPSPCPQLCPLYKFPARPRKPLPVWGCPPCRWATPATNSPCYGPHTLSLLCNPGRQQKEHLNKHFELYPSSLHNRSFPEVWEVSSLLCWLFRFSSVFSAQTAVTKYQRLRGLQTASTYLPQLQGQEQGPNRLSTCRGPVFCFIGGTFYLCLHTGKANQLPSAFLITT